MMEEIALISQKSRRVYVLIIFLFIAVVPFIFSYGRHFLFDYNKGPDSQNRGTSQEEQAGGIKQDSDFQSGGREERPIEQNSLPPVKYNSISTVVSGNKQEINVLEINLKNPRAEIKPVLSFDSVFGYEKLSSMTARSNAYAAVNAGFFHEFGQPSGMVVIDGEIITGSTGKYPIFMTGNGKAALDQFQTRLRVISSNKSLDIHDINNFGSPGQIVLYTDKFGTDNRSKFRNISIAIENNTVISVKEYDGKAQIPHKGMLMTFFEPDGAGESWSGSIFNLYKRGDKVHLEYTPNLGEYTQAYECGSWIVKDGQIVIGEKDEWVGVMTNWDPRTVVGIRDESTVILITVDGRQPGYSMGFTGQELGRFLLEYGINNAAMLDGGASTEMIIENRVVNRTSFKGQERPVAGGILVMVNGK